MGGLGDLAGLPRRHRQRFDRGPDPGSRCWRSRASASNCSPVRVDTPSAAANGSGVNAATNGVPSPPRAASSRAQAGEAGVGPGHKPRLDGGGMQHTPLRGQPEPAAFGFPASRLRLLGHASSHSASRSGTSIGAPIASVSIMCTANQTAPTIRPGIGAETGGCGEVFSMVSSTPLGFVVAVRIDLQALPACADASQAALLRFAPPGNFRRVGSWRLRGLCPLRLRGARARRAGSPHHRRRSAEPLDPDPRGLAGQVDLGQQFA